MFGGGEKRPAVVAACGALVGIKPRVACHEGGTTYALGSCLEKGCPIFGDTRRGRGSILILNIVFLPPMMMGTIQRGNSGEFSILGA